MHVGANWPVCGGISSISISKPSSSPLSERCYSVTMAKIGEEGSGDWKGTFHKENMVIV